MRNAIFTAALLDPGAHTPAGLQNPQGTAAQKRFDVYRNNVAAGLADALETAFPVLRKLVGDAFFRAMAGVYLRQHPPTSPVMMFYGDAMPRFLHGFGPARALPYLPDIARLELALRHSYHAADATAIDAGALADAAPDALAGLRLGFAPAVQVLRSDYPVHAIYLANTTPDAPAPVMRPEAVLITRPACDVRLHRIDAATADCATALLAGQTLGQATAGATLDLAALLGLLLAQGCITTFTQKDTA